MGKLKTFPIKTRCWYCGAEHNRTVSIMEREDGPNDGELSFCFQCGHFAIWDSSLTDGVRKPSPSENDRLKASKSALKLKMLWAIHMEGTKED